jgi:two-component system response regulator RegA
MSSAARGLLIVDDDARFAEALTTEFAERGYRVAWVAGLEELRALDLGPFDCALIDLRLRQDSGLDAVEWIRRCAPRVRVVVLTGYGSIATAVRAVRLGASNYLTKPVSVADLERAISDDAGREAPAPENWERPSLARHEREYIEYVLAECDGNISQAARRLGLHRQSLQRKLRKFTPR